MSTKHSRDSRTASPRWRRTALASAALFIGLAAPVAGFATQPGGCDISGVVSRALPSVVSITVIRVVAGEPDADGKITTAHVETSYGSGAVIDQSGVIATNKHVIHDALRIWVTFTDRTQYDAQLLAATSSLDFAMLKVPRLDPRPALRLSDNASIGIGQPVIAIGNPLGIGISASTGIISAVNRDLMRTPFDDFIQTDAAINPGNSGGPLLNCDGEIVGLNTALLSNNNARLGSIGLGFAIPSRDIAFVVSHLLESESFAPTWAGLTLQDMTPQLAMTFHHPDLMGAIVTRIDPDSPAARAGIEAGDIITAFDGEAQHGAREIIRAILVMPSGQNMTLTVWHGGERRDVSLVAERWPHMMALRADVLAKPEYIAMAQSEGVGFEVKPMTQADRERPLVPAGTGVVIDSVVPGSQAENEDLAAGDIILRTDAGVVRAPEDVDSRMICDGKTPGRRFALLVLKGTTPRWVSLYVGKLDIASVLAPLPSSPMTAAARNASATAR
jgi:serine protease Do